MLRIYQINQAHKHILCQKKICEVQNIQKFGKNSNKKKSNFKLDYKYLVVSNPLWPHRL